jgi:archaellum component FlaF (FlaF/FlaG flagellin family)
MKDIRIKKTLLFGIIYTGSLFWSCSNPTPIVEAEQFMYLSLREAKNAPVIKILNLANSSDTAFFVSMYYGGTTNYKQGDISAVIEADYLLVDAFNEAHNTAYLPLPAETYALDKTTIRIVNGENTSDAAKLTIRMSVINLINDVYLLPVTIKSVSGSLSLNEEQKTLYLAFHGNVDEDNGRDRWISAGASSEWQSTYPVKNVFDGSRNTYWHSDADGSMPQWFAVDMQGLKRISGFTWVNRTDRDQPAIPKHVKIETSMNGRDWTQVLDIPELPQSRVLQVLPLGQTLVAGYFRVTVLSNWADAPYTYVAEVDIYSGEAPEPEPEGQDIEKHNWTIVESYNDWRPDVGASKAIDGDPYTPWHTDPNVNNYPYWFIVDFHNTLKISGVIFWNRMEDPYATNFPKHVKWEASNNLENWTTILEIDELPGVKTEQYLPCTTVVSARYLRFTVYNGWTGEAWAFVGEMSIY